MNNDQVRVERLLPAPIEAVFAAWTDPASMSQWFSPTGQATVEADVRVGGRLRVVMSGEGIKIEHLGEYLTITPPCLLSFTWSSRYTGNAPSVVTVSFAPEGEGTRLVLVHDGLPVETAEAHRTGWGSIVRRLIESLINEEEVSA